MHRIRRRRINLLKARASGVPHRGGEVVATHGRHYVVELADGNVLQCYPRGKKSDVACGDRVQVQVTGEGQGVIESVDERRTLLFRAEVHRQKLIAANVTQVAIVVASTPTFYDELVARCLVAAHAQHIDTLIVLNKCDLVEESQVALQRLDIYLRLGYRLVALSARGDVSPLREQLAGHRTVLVGQSGMGKSTLVNALIPDAGARVGEVSLALDSGRHTTTAARQYRLDPRSQLIDSPGMQEFGIAHLTPTQLMAGFPELSALRGQCRFIDCLHLSEPGCAINVTDSQAMHPERLRIYRRLATSLRDAPKVY